MRLITEYSAPEKLETGVDGKNHYIEGVFMQAEQLNKNRRVYDKPMLEKAVAQYVETFVQTNRAVGELNHPAEPTVNYKEASHIIESLEWKGNDVIGRARILSTPNGIIAKALIDDGVQLGVSSRGMGSLRTVEGVDHVNNDFILNTVDIVHDPSAPAAFVNGVMEGVSWRQNAQGIWVRDGEDEINEEIELKPGKRLHDIKQLLSGLI